MNVPWLVIQLAIFWNERAQKELKVGNDTPLLLQSVGYRLNGEIFRMGMEMMNGQYSQLHVVPSGSNSYVLSQPHSKPPGMFVQSWVQLWDGITHSSSSEVKKNQQKTNTWMRVRKKSKSINKFSSKRTVIVKQTKFHSKVTIKYVLMLSGLRKSYWKTTLYGPLKKIWLYFLFTHPQIHWAQHKFVYLGLFQNRTKEILIMNRISTPGAYCIKLWPDEKTQVKSVNSGKHNFTIDFTVGKKQLWLKLPKFFSGKSFMQ